MKKLKQTLNTATPWHKASYDRFLQERLPQLLATQLPLGSYQVTSEIEYTCCITLSLLTAETEVEVTYHNLPQPDTDGIFQREGKCYVVLPFASHEDLETAEIACVGERLYDTIAAQLGAAPADLPWDESLARAWLPLDRWIARFLEQASNPLDSTNWLSAKTHLRRLWLPEGVPVFAPGHLGRTCPVETPEGPNVGRILVIASGAEIRSGKLVITDSRPEAGFGLSTSCIPLVEYDESCRLLMGANMMRQWITPPDPEPALVQTGAEPDVPGFWCGRNLLTAYVSWGAESFEDALIFSESAAQRFAYPKPIEPGDKFSNRHGAKGVLSRILPDAAMPHLPDGTPVDIVYDCIGLYSRFNLGQVREAVLGRLAKAEGEVAITPLFQSPKDAELRGRLQKANLPEDGQEVLTAGLNGQPLERASTVGWVYWGRLNHLASDKFQVSVGPGNNQRLGIMEFCALQKAEAPAVIHDQFHTRAAENPDSATLESRVIAGEIMPAEPPTPRFLELARRLSIANIQMDFTGNQVTFQLAPPSGEVLELAHPIPHPWLQEQSLLSIGVYKEVGEYGAVVEANTRLAKLTASRVPQSLHQKALTELERAIVTLFETLLRPYHVQPGAKVMFHGRAVAAPAKNIRHDQLGIPEEFAWTLFGPQLIRELGSAEEVKARSERATQALDALMARSWLLLHRAPTVEPTGILAFHPYRHSEHVLRIHPMSCNLMNADFDGDQIAVYLPLSAEAQQEAGAKLSIAGHLRRDPNLLGELLPIQGARYGLALLARTPQGQAELESVIGTKVELSAEILNRFDLLRTAQSLLATHGEEATLDILDTLTWRGYEVAKLSGISLSAFVGSSFERLPRPETDDLAAWYRYEEAMAEKILALPALQDNDLGPFSFVVKSGARSSLLHIVKWVGFYGIVPDVYGKQVPIRHSLQEGFTVDEHNTVSIGARLGIQSAHISIEHIGQAILTQNAPMGFTVLARAMRSRHPGIVFARAAATQETDPLREPMSRLFVGLKTN